MVHDEFMDLPMEGSQVLSVKVSSILYISDGAEEGWSVIGLPGGGAMIKLPRHEILNRIDQWHEAKLRSVN